MNTLPDNRLVTLHTGTAGVRTALAGEFRALEGAAGEPVLEFIASTEQIDRYGDVVRQAGIKLDAFRRNPVVPDCHDYSSVAKILGSCDLVEVRGNQLVNRVRFAMDNPMGVLAYKLAEKKHLRAESIGFLPLKWMEFGGGREGYDFLESELLEISLVVVPANAGAVTEALAAGTVSRQELGNVVEYLRSLVTAADAASLSQTKQTPATPDPAPGGKAPVPDWLPSLRAFVAALKTK